MDGLLHQDQPRQEPQPSQQRAAQDQSSQPPQEQGQQDGNREQFDIVSGQMIQWISSDEGYQSITKSLESGEPQQVMANILGRLMMMMNQGAYMSGKKIPPKILIQAGSEAARALSMVAQKMGVIDKSNEKDITENAFFDGIAMFATESAEEALTQEDRVRYTQLLDQIEQMAEQAEGQQTQPQQDQQPQQQGLLASRGQSPRTQQPQEGMA